MSKQIFFKGTFILTCAGLMSRVIGFFYRIFLSHTIGAQGLGLYQLIMPLQNLVLAFTVSGIQTSLSRLIASRLALKKEPDAKKIFCTGTFMSFSLSSFAAWILYFNASFFAVQILKEPLTESLIKILSFQFPLIALHSCINSYYFAEKKTGVPSGLQLMEQIIRVSSSWILFQIFLSKNIPVTAAIAVGGSLISEIFSAAAGLLLIGLRFSGKKTSFFASLSFVGEIFHTALPLTLNRILLTLLGSIEVILIPQQLQAYGLSGPDSLKIYGIFTGMALPLILFPSTVTNSASVMLMPSIAEMQALDCKERIRSTALKVCTGCMTLGILCTAFFFLLSPFLGIFLFKNPSAGLYIRTLSFICPFLYANTALTSILHGLGRTTRSLVHNTTGILIRISFVLFLIPVIGIKGYLYGILISEMLLSCLHIFALHREILYRQ